MRTAIFGLPAFLLVLGAQTRSATAETRVESLLSAGVLPKAETLLDGSTSSTPVRLPFQIGGSTSILSYRDGSVLVGGVSTRFGWSFDWATQVAVQAVGGFGFRRGKSVEVFVATALGPSIQWHERLPGTGVGWCWEVFRAQLSVKMSPSLSALFQVGSTLSLHDHANHSRGDIGTFESALFVASGISFRL